MRRTAHGGAVIVLVALAAAPGAVAQRLPHTAVPEHYDLSFAPDSSKDEFSGDETIRARFLEPARSLTLNSLDLELHLAEITSAGVTQRARVTLDADRQMATLEVAKAVPAGPAVIRIKFTGILNNRLRGFYRAHSGGRNYAITQFEATDARRAFPSFDEPAYKATFSITLVVDRGDTAISNGRLVSDTPGPGPRGHTLKFATTPRMSSYLVAMAVGDFQCVSGTADGTPIRVCATPDKKDLGHYALEAAEHVLRYYDQYFAIKYPFEKLDLVAAPDFEAGAMENTACIIFRESALLMNTDHASPESQIGIAGVIAHEMAHQWFGDLVTMDWWDNIWLNEGFATWMSAKPLEAWHPEWNVGVSQASATGDALDDDSVEATRPIRARRAETPDEINALFDGIAYGKTAAVLRMLEAYEGAETFRAGVNAYLKQHAYGNATASDFWDAQAQASKLPIGQIMPTFVNQPGAPLVTVSASCQGGREAVTLSQRRYFYDRAAFNRGSDEVWQVPVCLKWPDGKGGYGTRCDLLKQPQQTFALPGCPPWVFGNAGAHGYYRSGYDRQELRELAKDAEADLTPAERIALTNDEWALVKLGKDSITDFMGLSENLGNDPAADVTELILRQVDDIGERLVDDADRDAYRSWVRQYLAPQAAKLGWDATPGDGAEVRGLRAAVLHTLGYTARDPGALAAARGLAERYLVDPSSVDPALAREAIRLAAISGSAQLYDELLAHAKAAKSPEQYYGCLFALADFSDPLLLRRTLDFALTPDVRSQDFLGLIDSVIYNPAGRDLGWDFVKAHWVEIEKRVSYGGPTGIIFAAGGFCDSQHQEEVSRFFSEHPVPGGARPLRQTMENIRQCIDLRAQQGPGLAAWLAARSAGAGR